MIRATTDAVLAKLREDPVLATCTFDGDVAGEPQRYCVININNGDRYGDRLAGPEVSATFRVAVRSIGADRWGAQAVAERVFAQLMNVKLTITGRNCSTIRHDGGQPTTRDDSDDPIVWVATDFFTFTSDPTS